MCLLLFTSFVFWILDCGSVTQYYLKALTKDTRMNKNTFLRKSSIYLWNGQSLCFFGPVLGVRAGVCVRRDTRPVERLEADLGAEEVADGLQRAAGVRGQRGVRQQVWDQTVGLTHHRDVHYHAGARRLEKRRVERRGRDREWENHSLFIFSAVMQWRCGEQMSHHTDARSFFISIPKRSCLSVYWRQQMHCVCASVFILN